MVKRLIHVLLAGLTLAFSVSAATAQERALPQSRAQMQLSFAPLVKRTAPAVVNIYTRRVVTQAQQSPLFSDPFFRRFFGERFATGPRQRRVQTSLGSGVIVSPDGLIVTNHHVIQGADEITVAMTDRREFPAELVLDDERTDLAVLRIDAADSPLPHLELRDSDELEVGDLVLAIGNPFNVGQTVTSGIISAVARTDVGISDFQFFIQTDADINPGNSGGALVSMDGRLAGVNTAIFSRSGGSHGIGFAIPANMVRAVIRSAAEGLAYVQRPWLGAATQEVTAEIAASMGLDRPQGVLVRALYPNGPAQQAGLAVGDVIVGVDDRPVNTPEALLFRLGTRPIGGSARLGVQRRGALFTAELALIRAPEVPPRNTTLLRGAHPLAGATVANLSPAVAEELGLETAPAGVVVLRVAERSPAWRLRLRTGDRILRINGIDADKVLTLSNALDDGRKAWDITVQRGTEVTTVRIRT